MAEWCVELLGDREILDVLASTFDAPPCVVSFDRELNRHVMVLTSFHRASNVQTVQRLAQEEATILSGVLALSRAFATSPLHIGAVHGTGEGGEKTVFVSASSTMVVSASARLVVVDGEGNPVPATSLRTTLRQILPVMVRDQTVATVARLIQKDDFRTWQGLYRVYEIIAHDAGAERRNWVSAREETSFRQSANHPDTAGDDARHGHVNTDPSPHPMTLIDAHAWLQHLLDQWVAHKIA